MAFIDWYERSIVSTHIEKVYWIITKQSASVMQFNVFSNLIFQLDSEKKSVLILSVKDELLV